MAATYCIQDLEIRVGNENEIAELEPPSKTNFSRFSSTEFEPVAKILGETEVLAKFNPSGNSPGDQISEVLLEQVGPALWALKWRDVSSVINVLGAKQSEKIGKLKAPGQPYLHELLAEQRLTERMPLPKATLDTVRALADEKLQNLRYVVAGWTSVSDAELPGKIKRDWDLDLAILAAAEEILGINGSADAGHRATRWEALKIFRQSVDRITKWEPTLRSKLKVKNVAAAGLKLDKVLGKLTGDSVAVTDSKEMDVEPEFELSEGENAKTLGEGRRDRFDVVHSLPSKKSATSGANWIGAIAAAFSAVATFLTYCVAETVHTYQEEMDAIQQYQVAVSDGGQSIEGEQDGRKTIELEVVNGTEHVMTQIKPAMPAGVSSMTSSTELGSLAPGSSGTVSLTFEIVDWEKVEMCNFGISYTNPVSDRDFSERRYAFVTRHEPLERQSGNNCSVQGYSKDTN